MIYWTLTTTGKARRFMWSNPKNLTPETRKRMRRQFRKLKANNNLFATKEEALKAKELINPGQQE